MSSDRAISRYRRWYGRLLHLYPRPFRDRFSEAMTQTFTDLARERTDADRSLIGFAIGAFAETSAHILRENMTQLMQTTNYLRWVAVTASSTPARGPEASPIGPPSASPSWPGWA